MTKPMLPIFKANGMPISFAMNPQRMAPPAMQPLKVSK